MPYWLVTTSDVGKHGWMGPYITYTRALDEKDNLEDGHAEIFETVSNNEMRAKREVRAKLVKAKGLDEGYKNLWCQKEED